LRAAIFLLILIAIIAIYFIDTDIAIEAIIDYIIEPDI
jgi:hypothetical protein